MADLQREFLSGSAAWKALQETFSKNGSSINMPQMFKEDSDRFKKYRYMHDNI